MAISDSHQLLSTEIVVANVDGAKKKTCLSVFFVGFPEKLESVKLDFRNPNLASKNVVSFINETFDN